MRIVPLKPLIRQTAKNLNRNLPTILTISGGVGSIAALVMGIQEGPVFKKRLDLALARIRKERGIPDGEPLKLSTSDYWALTKELAPIIAPSVLTEVFSLVCMYCALKEGNERQARLLSLYSGAELSLQDLHNKMMEKLGEETTDEIYQAVAQERAQQKPLALNSPIETGKGQDRFMDSWSRERFYSTINFVEAAKNRYNSAIIEGFDMEASMNDWYFELGLPPRDCGSGVGYYAGHLLDIRFVSFIDDDNSPTIGIEYINRPRDLTRRP